jgi:plastocyanin
VSKRKFLSVLLISVLLVVALSACGSKKKKTTPTPTPTVQAAPSATAELSATATPQAAPSATAEPKATATVQVAPSATAEPSATATSGATVEPTSQASNPSEVVVNIQNFAFDPKSLTIPVGTTVRFVNNDSASHTVTADDGSFDSGTLSNGQEFTFTFDKAGTYPYYCKFHGGKGGVGMSGTITVE